MLQDISYKDYRRNNDIHGTVLYPAVMVAPVQEDVLRDIYRQDTVHSILDPFHGSGTALYESHKIFPYARIYGCDINPLANLITKTKLTGVSENIQQEIEMLRQRITNDTSTKIVEFENREKWFRDDVAQSLSKIRRAIIQVEDKNNRLFFWCMMCDIIRRYSNSRSSTYKLHIKPQEKIDTMENNAIGDFLHSVEVNYHWFEAMHCNNYSLSKQNLMDYLPRFQNNKVDLLITSPPYGDNQTTVPYGLFSSLSLKWIAPDDLELEGWELDNYSAIDSHSLGSGRIETTLNNVQSTLLNPYLDQISDDKQAKVKKFFRAYFECLDLFTQVVEKYLVLTLGNRTVDRVKIDLADISGKYLKSKGFKEYQTVSRDILYKRTPSLTSIVQDEPVESMSKEYVLIYKK
ncbi:hypothetical protein AALA82_00030 [Oscillospiraceae bacterium 50-16]